MISYHTAIFPKYEIKKEKGDQMLYEYNMVSNFDPCIDMYQFYIRFTISFDDFTLFSIITSTS